MIVTPQDREHPLPASRLNTPSRQFIHYVQIWTYYSYRVILSYKDGQDITIIKFTIRFDAPSELLLEANA